MKISNVTQKSSANSFTMMYLQSKVKVINQVEGLD